MTFKECSAALELENAADLAATLGMEWEKSQSHFSPQLPFLNHEFLKATCERYFEDPLIFETLSAAAERLKQNEAALRLLWHQHYLVVQNYERFWLTCYRFPELAALKQDARAYYLLLALSGAHYFGDVHERLGISDAELKPTIHEIRMSVRGSIERKGLIGVAPHYSGWWQGFFSGRLYRLGRLTFLREKYNWPYHIFEDKKGELSVMAADDLAFNAKGLLQLKGEEASWRSRWIETSDRVSGSPVLATGYAQNRSLELKLSDWHRLVEPGDVTVSVHISPGEPMALEACIESFAQAKRFFEKYFPNEKPALFTCDTWLLDPQLSSFLKPSSNIVEFQKRFFLLPNLTDAEFVAVRTIFGAAALSTGFESVEHKSSLQKGAAAFMRKGGKLRHGYGFIPWSHVWKAPVHE